MSNNHCYFEILIFNVFKNIKTNIIISVNWVDPSKTLREQGIDEGEPVLLRRKFFFSDGNIDSHDPVQLNLLYVQVIDIAVDCDYIIVEELNITYFIYFVLHLCRQEMQF